MYGIKFLLNKIWFLILLNISKFSVSVLLFIFFIFIGVKKGVGEKVIWGIL